jgi:hypothetical protein
MSSMFCPKCSAPRPMNLSITEQEITGPDDLVIKVVTETYHCVICHSFVRSNSVHRQANDYSEAPQLANAKTSPR